MSFDCVGVATGPEIAVRLEKETSEVYSEAEEQVPDAVLRVDSGGMGSVVDHFDAAQDWWTPTDSYDADGFDERMDEFLNFVRLVPATSIIVVSHSYFIRAFFQRYSDPSSLDSKISLSCTLADMSEHKIKNCGVVAADLDFSSSFPVTGAELMFDSQVEGSHREPGSAGLG